MAARQRDLGKLNKAKLADFLARKLSKEELLAVAQSVQGGSFSAASLGQPAGQVAQPGEAAQVGAATPSAAINPETGRPFEPQPL